MQQFNLSVTPFSHDWNWLTLALYCSCSLVMVSSSFTLFCNKRHQKWWGCAYLALFLLHSNPELINKTPFSLALITLGLHRNSKFTLRNRSQKYTKACSWLDFAAGSQCLRPQEHKLQGPVRRISGFPNLSTVSLEKRWKFVSDFLFDKQAVKFLLQVKNKDKHIFLISQNGNKKECDRDMKIVVQL